MKNISFILLSLLIHAILYAREEIKTAFDIGSGSIKMQIVKTDLDKIETLHTQIEKFSPTGRDAIFQNGIITPEGIEKIKCILGMLKLKAETFNSIKFHGFATDLFRRSSNGQEFINQISNELSIDIKIITPEEEGFLGFLTVVEENNLEHENLVVLDIGSGSYQIVCMESDRLYVHSAPFGKVFTHELIKSNNLLKLVNSLSEIHPVIFKKLNDPNVKVVGIGAHPKFLFNNERAYDLSDVIKALEAKEEVDMDYSGLVLVKTIMEALHIAKIKYKGGGAGNTSGFFRDQRNHLSTMK